MRAQQLEKQGALDGAQTLVLARRRQGGEIVAETGNAGAIDLPRILLCLIAMLRKRFHPRTFRIPVFIAAPWTGELPIDVNDYVRFRGARPAFIAGEDTRAGRLHGAGWLTGRHRNRVAGEQLLALILE